MSDPMLPVNRYEQLCRERDAARSAAQNLAREAFMAGAAVLFDRFQGMESFGWSQYTPYFNDGDACRFGVYADEPDINGQSSGEFPPGYRYDRDASGKYVRVKLDDRDERCDWAEAVSAFVHSFPEEDLEHLFGDHVCVTIHRNGTAEVDSYEHD